MCVCQQHQNVKLLMAAIPDNCDYKKYLVKLICSVENHSCMKQSSDLPCKDCSERISDITQLFSHNDIDMDNSM